MATGAQLLALAETRIGEKYVNVQVPKDNANWHGPWDCAEFASWLVYQKTGKLYGCIDDSDDPAVADAYSGAWVRDAVDRPVDPITQREANGIAGAVLIRKPPAPGKMGHIAITDGRGGTVEAAGINLGVRRDRVEGRLWHYVVTIPGAHVRVDRLRGPGEAVAVPSHARDAEHQELARSHACNARFATRDSIRGRSTANTGRTPLPPSKRSRR